MTPRRSLGPADRWRFAAIALILVEGGIHLQQYDGTLHSVPTISTLFLLNAIGAAGITLVLAGSRDSVGILAALAAIGLSLGALVSLAIARASTLFGYSEPTLRGVVLLAAAVEVLAVAALAGFVLARASESATSNGTAAAA